MNENRKIFSLPIFPGITNEEFENVIKPFIEENKHSIYDFYATIRISPFDQDVMWGTDEINDDLIETALKWQKTFDIPVTCTFNDKFINPSLRNRDIWIENFKPLYEKGLRRVILPFLHWLFDGKIRKEFPELFIKNTILQELGDPQKIYEHAKHYDFLYLDRNLMRDKDTLKILPVLKRKIKQDFNKDIVFSLLVNEGCRGKCPVQQEHYLFNAKRVKEEAPYFLNPISLFTCNRWSFEDPAYFLKVSDLAPDRKVFEEMLKYFDVFKLHGRSEASLFEDSLMIIKNWNDGKDPLPGKKALIQASVKDYDKWLKDTENCKFQCWNCKKCENNLAVDNTFFAE